MPGRVLPPLMPAQTVASHLAEASPCAPGCDLIVAGRLGRPAAGCVDQLESSSAAALMAWRVDCMVVALRSSRSGAPVMSGDTACRSRPRRS